MNNYGVKQINSLEGLQAIRVRPGMYIGSLSNPNQLVYEAWDNSLDEYSAGYGNEIDVLIDKDNYITITDRGRGIPVGDHPEWKNEDGTPMNTLTGVLTKMHAGGKFNRDGSSAYFSGSVGLHGLGLKVDCALSDDLIVTVKRDSNVYQQSFSKGKPTTDVLNIGKTRETGTTIKFHPDKEIFKETIIPNDKQLQARLHEITALNANLKINYINEIANVNKTFHYENGIIDYIKNELLVNKKTLFEKPLYYKGQYKDNETMTAEICFIYQDNIEDNQIIKTFANNITTREHGTHLNGFKESFRDNINAYGIKQKLITSPLEIKYLLDNICLIVSVHLKECELEGQTKNKLGNTIAKDCMIQIVNDFFKSLNKEQKEIINTIITRANAVKEAEEAARKARINSRKANKITKIALPGKLADCSTNKGYSEIFYCEGQSASGSAKAARDSSFQAIMPLRGKILNTEKVDFDKAMNSETAKAFIASIGTGIGKQFDISKCRYDKIIMMCFTGDTEIKLANNVVTTFEELVKLNTDSSNIYPVYSVNQNNEITIGEAYNPRITGYVTELLEITLDNHKIIKCTPNHLFMLNDGSYKQAQALTPQDELKGINAQHIIDKKIIRYDTIIPIYDLTVKQYHNFALNSGVFVHNCDADIDGLHISNLILTLIYNYMRPLLSEGYVYNTTPPLYKVIEKKKQFYLQDDEALKQYRKTHKDFVLQRFKGLGEMDYTELWETTMNPETRILKRVTVESVEKMIKAFDICMGKDVEIRRTFIENNAYKAVLVE